MLQTSPYPLTSLENGLDNLDRHIPNLDVLARAGAGERDCDHDAGIRDSGHSRAIPCLVRVLAGLADDADAVVRRNS